MDDKVVTVTFKVWANSDEEAETLSKELGNFVNEQGQEGRKVTAKKLTEALLKWKQIPLIKNAIDRHFTL